MWDGVGNAPLLYRTRTELEIHTRKDLKHVTKSGVTNNSWYLQWETPCSSLLLEGRYFPHKAAFENVGCYHNGFNSLWDTTKWWRFFCVYTNHKTCFCVFFKPNAPHSSHSDQQIIKYLRRRQTVHQQTEITSITQSILHYKAVHLLFECQYPVE